MKRITTVAHEFLSTHLDSSANICDLTSGNGNDTLFCAQHFKSVIAFDIQAEAIKKAKEKCINFTNCIFVQASHELLDTYIHQKMDAYIFNSGYLPESKSMIITKTKSSWTAFAKAIELLNPKGYLALSFYRKHEGGEDEYTACLQLLSKHESIKEVFTYTYEDDSLSPRLHIFQKL